MRMMLTALSRKVCGSSAGPKMEMRSRFWKFERPILERESKAFLTLKTDHNGVASVRKTSPTVDASGLWFSGHGKVILLAWGIKEGVRIPERPFAGVA